MNDLNKRMYLFIFQFLLVMGFGIQLQAQCTENYDWVKKEDICSDPNNGSTTIFFQNNAVPCDPGNGNLDLHVYYFVTPSGPAKAPANYNPFTGASYITTTPLTNTNMFYLGSIDAADLCATGYFFTHNFVNNIACSGIDVTFFLMPWDRDLDSDNDGVFGEYNQTGATCDVDREEFTVLSSPCDPVIDVVLMPVRETCEGGPGSISATVSGGIPPYTYQWNTGAQTSSISGVPSAWYIITVSDNGGCSRTATTFVSGPAPEVICTTTSTDVSCNGADDATATIVAVAPGTFCLVTGYVWSTGDTSATITGLSPGTYSVTTTSDACCPSVCQITITEPPALINVIGNVSNASCQGASDGSAIGTGVGGVPPYIYQWSNNTTNQTITGLAAGTYMLTITDNTGCTATNSLTILDGPVLIASVSTTEVTCNGNGDGALTVSVTNASNPLTIIWSDGQTAATATGLSAGTYMVTVTDVNGCIVTTTGIVTEPDKLSGFVAIVDEWCGVALGQATVTATNGNGSYTYVWSNGQTSSTATGLVAGQYMVTVQDAEGCCLLLTVLVGLDDCDLCVEAQNGAIDICAVLTADPSHPLATLDCDEGGVNNLIECNNGGDPLEPSDDCAIAEATSMDICAQITNNPDSPLATLDCDNGGVTNEVECSTGEDPFDPADDCQSALDAELNICELINYDASHPLATLDCDNGGINNYIECVEGSGDPADPADDCYAAVIADIDLCTIINGDPTHPWASLDCDNGGIPNLVECDNGADPNDPIDDNVPDLCTEAILGNIDICDTLTINPTLPLATLDCDGDGVTNIDECDDGTDPLDPCDFDDGSITGPITADQSDCPNLCPDLTPVTTILPGNIAGISPVEVAVEITELNSITTDGSAIVIRMPSDPRLTFTWDPTLTMAALTPIQNADWTYLGDNGIVHTWLYNGPGLIINGGATSAFGYQAVYDPQFTDGQTTITASIVPFGGGECNILNDTDSERLVYFE